MSALLVVATILVAGCGTDRLGGEPAGTPTATRTPAPTPVTDGPRDEPCFRVLFREPGPGSCTTRRRRGPQTRIVAIPHREAARLSTLEARLVEVERPDRLVDRRGTREPVVGKAFVVVTLDVSNRTSQTASVGANVALFVDDETHPRSRHLRAAPRPEAIPPGQLRRGAYVFEIPRRPDWQYVAQQRPCAGVVVSDFGTIAHSPRTRLVAWLRLGPPTVSPADPDPDEPCGA